MRPVIYLNAGGQGPGLVPDSAAHLPLGDRGFLYGDGLFETMLALDRSIPLLPWHLERLGASAAALGIPCDLEAAGEGARLMAREAAGPGSYALRLTLSRGVGLRRGYEPPAEAHPTLLITAVPYAPPIGPLTAATASIRVLPGALTVRHKSLSALDKVMARAEAARAGVDEALMLNVEGRVAEGAAANLFLCRGGRWLTPALSEGCLPGVMRRRVMALTGAQEARVCPDDLVQADAVFLTSALSGCLPLASVDGQRLRAGIRPPSPAALFAPVI